MWDSLWMAIALLLVIEGVLPFLDPKGMRRSMLMIAELDDRTLRIIGLFSMLGGVALLYLVN